MLNQILNSKTILQFKLGLVQQTVHNKIINIFSMGVNVL